MSILLLQSWVSYQYPIALPALSVTALGTDIAPVPSNVTVTPCNGRPVAVSFRVTVNVFGCPHATEVFPVIDEPTECFVVE